MGEARLKRGLPPSHPGVILDEVVFPGLGMSREEIAVRLKVTRKMLYKITTGENAITPAMALRLSKFLGNSPEFWLNLQAAWDLAQLRQSMATELAGISTVPSPPRL